jgi:hypothetical protein
MLFKKIIAVYSESHAKPINTKSSITDCQSRWFIYLPLGYKHHNHKNKTEIFTAVRTSNPAY